MKMYEIKNIDYATGRVQRATLPTYFIVAEDVLNQYESAEEYINEATGFSVFSYDVVPV